MTEKQYAPSAQDKKVTTKAAAPTHAAGVRTDVQSVSSAAKTVSSAGASPVSTEKRDMAEQNEQKQEETKLEATNPGVSPAGQKTADKKKEAPKIVKKDSAVVRGSSLPISKKHSMSICNMIRGKTPDRAIEMLEEVLLMKRAVPMNDREVPHRKGMMSGRYPLSSSRAFIDLLKQLKANSLVNGIDNPVIKIAKADKASRPYRRGGTRAKKAHVYLEAVEKLQSTKSQREIKKTD